MQTSSFKNISATLTLLVAAFSTSYAHAAPRYLCTHDNPAKQSKLELDIRAEAEDASFKYSYLPMDASAVVEGTFEVIKTDVTWSHFVFTGKDGNISVKLSVPAGLDGNSVYAELDYLPNARDYDWTTWMECKRR